MDKIGVNMNNMLFHDEKGEDVIVNLDHVTQISRWQNLTKVLFHDDILISSDKFEKVVDRIRELHGVNSING